MVQEQKEALPKEEEFFKEQLQEEEKEEEKEGRQEGEAAVARGAQAEEKIKEEKQEEVEFDPHKEKEDSVELFKENLISVLNSEAVPDSFLDEYNLVLAQYLSEEEGRDFKARLEKALLTNQEELTTKKFYLEDKSVLPTVGNWINYFIKQYGSDEFDNLTLSKFLSNSENAARLEEKEKRLVGKVLILYRNLKFFPKPFEDKPIEQWEIIPVTWKKELLENSDQEEKSQDQAPAQEQKQAQKEELKEEQKAEGGQTVPEEKYLRSEPSVGQWQPKQDQQEEDGDQEKEKKETEVEQQPTVEPTPEAPASNVNDPQRSRLEELKKYRDQYPEGSLERKAVEGEIEELENGNPPAGGEIGEESK